MSHTAQEIMLSNRDLSLGLARVYLCQHWGPWRSLDGYRCPWERTQDAEVQTTLVESTEEMPFREGVSSKLLCCQETE